jgi:hypothetical protein
MHAYERDLHLILTSRPEADSVIACADTITRHTERIDPKLRRDSFERAIALFDEVDQQGDPYAETLRRALRHNC